MTENKQILSFCFQLNGNASNVSLISGRKLKTKTPGMILAWSTGPRASLSCTSDTLTFTLSRRKKKKRGERRPKRIYKPSQKRLKLIVCLLSQKFDKTLLHHLTLNGFMIGLNIPL